MPRSLPHGADCPPPRPAAAPTGLAPEYIEARPGKDFVTNPRAQYNLQRPEAVEAFFVMYRVTGDPKYQEYGWEVFSAFETFTKVNPCLYPCFL